MQNWSAKSSSANIEKIDFMRYTKSPTSTTKNAPSRYLSPPLPRSPSTPHPPSNSQSFLDSTLSIVFRLTPSSHAFRRSHPPLAPAPLHAHSATSVSSRPTDLYYCRAFHASSMCIRTSNTPLPDGNPKSSQSHYCTATKYLLQTRSSTLSP